MSKGIRSISVPGFGYIGVVRVKSINGTEWYVGKDVTELLGYKNASNAICKFVNDTDRFTTVIDTNGGKQSLVVINKAGVYSLLISGKTEKAKYFRDWAVREAFPDFT